MTDNISSTISPSGHLLVTINGVTVDMGSVTTPMTAGDAYLGYIAQALQAIADYNDGKTITNNAVSQFVTTPGDTQAALDSRYASLAQGVLATNAVPKTTTVNGKPLSGNISLTASDISITASDLTSGVLLGGSALAPKVSIRLKSDTTTNWISANPTLALGELVYASNLGYLFIGDGVSNFTTLAGLTSNAFASYATVQNYVNSMGFASQYTTVSAGTGLTGGGDLTANRTLSVTYGTAAGTAAQGNDSRIVNAVPNTRTINTKPLSANVVLAASDITTGVLPAAQVPTATTTVQGAVKLAGDLAGTAALPTVAKVNGISVSGTPTSGQALIATSGTAASWSTITSVTDSAVAAVVDQPVTKAKLDATYVKQSSLVAAPVTLPGYHQDTLIVPPGSVSVTLGADPLPNSLLVFSGGQTINPTLSGRTLTFPAQAAENKVLYAYDQNNPEPAPLGSPLYIYDSFDRADSATTLYRTESGQTWVIPINNAGEQPVWGISSNLAYCVNAGASNDGYAYVDAGTADVVVQVKFTTVSGSSGLFVRGADAKNGYTSNYTGLFQRVNAVNSTSTGWSIIYPTAFTSGDTMRIVCSGTKIEVFQDKGSTGNFVSMGSNTDNMYTANTKHGFRTNNTTARLDNFKIFGR